MVTRPQDGDQEVEDENTVGGDPGRQNDAKVGGQSTRQRRADSIR